MGNKPSRIRITVKSDATHLDTIGESKEDMLRKSSSSDAAFAKNKIDVKTAKRKSRMQKLNDPAPQTDPKDEKRKKSKSASKVPDVVEDKLIRQKTVKK